MQTTWYCGLPVLRLYSRTWTCYRSTVQPGRWRSTSKLPKPSSERQTERVREKRSDGQKERERKKVSALFDHFLMHVNERQADRKRETDKKWVLLKTIFLCMWVEGLDYNLPAAFTSIIFQRTASLRLRFLFHGEKEKSSHIQTSVNRFSPVYAHYTGQACWCSRLIPVQDPLEYVASLPAAEIRCCWICVV